MVPVQMGALKHDVGNDAEDSQRDTLLNDLQLYQVKRPAILDESHAIGRNLTAVLEEGNEPREGNNAN